jgi:hypothetical protein
MAKPGFSLKGNLKEISRGETALRTLLKPVSGFEFADLSVFEKNLRYDTSQRLDFIPNNHKFLVQIDSPNIGPASSIITLRKISNISPDSQTGTLNLSIEVGDLCLCSPSSDTKVNPFNKNRIIKVTKPTSGIDDVGSIELTRPIRNGEGASDGTEFYSSSTKPGPSFLGNNKINSFAANTNSNEKVAIIKQNDATYSPASGRFTFGTDLSFTFTEGDIISSVKVKGNDTPFQVAKGSLYFNKKVDPNPAGYFGSSFYPLIVSEYTINEKGQTSFILKRKATNSPVLFNMLPAAHQVVPNQNFIKGKVLGVGDLLGGTFSDSAQNNQTISNITQSTTHGFTMGDTGVSTSGSGTEYSFTIKRDVTSYSISATSAFGDNFTATDTITILGTQLGGTTPANDCTITVDSTFTHSGTKTGVLNTTVTGTPNTTNLLTTTGSGTGLQISIKTQAKRVIKVTIDDGGTGHKVGDIITCPKENVTSGTLDLTFKITSATNERAAESPRLMIFNSPNIIQFTRQLPVSAEDLRGLAPPLFRSQGGPDVLISLGAGQSYGTGGHHRVYTYFEPLSTMYNINKAFQNTESVWAEKLEDNSSTFKRVLERIQEDVDFAIEASKGKFLTNKDNVNQTTNALIIDGALQIQDPGKANDVANISSNIFNDCPRAPAVYIKEEDINNPGSFTHKRAFSTFDGPWTADSDAGKKHIRTFETTDQNNANFVSVLNIGDLEFHDRVVIDDYASKNLLEVPAGALDRGGTGPGRYQSAKITGAAGEMEDLTNSPRSTGFTHKMPVVVKELDESTGEINDVVYFLLLQGPLQ